MTALTHPRLREIGAYLDDVRRALDDLVRRVPAAEMNAAPAPPAWSGAQILQHLGKVEGATTKMLEGLFARALAAGLAMETATSSQLGSLDQFMTPEGALRRLDAPDRLRPGDAPDLAASWASLVSVRERTYRAYATVDGRALAQVTGPHPLFGPLDGYQWLLFLGRHEERHLGQLRRLLGH